MWNKYADKYGSRKARSNTHNVEDIKLAIERAIALLKQQGYKVLRPVTQFEEC